MFGNYENLETKEEVEEILSYKADQFSDSTYVPHQRKIIAAQIDALLDIMLVMREAESLSDQTVS